MKKLLSLAITLCLLSSFLQAQTITPYDNNDGSDPNNPYTNQLTYFDYNYIGTKLHSFLKNRMDLVPKDSEVLKNVNGDIFSSTFTYQNYGFNTSIKTLNFGFILFPVESNFVVKELKITGDIDLIVEFWAKYWTTTPNFNMNASKLLVTNRFLQDKISVYGGKTGKIVVENTAITDLNLFISDLKKRSNSTTLEKKQNDIADNISVAKRTEYEIYLKKHQATLDSLKNNDRADRERFASRKIKSYDIEVIKDKTNIQFKEDYPNELKEAVTHCLSKQKDGTFLIRIFENYEFGEIYKYQAGLLSKL